MIVFERLGTGTTDILGMAKKAGLKEPEFLQDDMFRTVIYRKQTVTVIPQVIRLIMTVNGEK